MVSLGTTRVNDVKGDLPPIGKTKEFGEGTAFILMGFERINKAILGEIAEIGGVKLPLKALLKGDLNVFFGFLERREETKDRA